MTNKEYSNKRFQDIKNANQELVEVNCKTCGGITTVKKYKLKNK